MDPVQPHPSDAATGALLSGFGLVLVGSLALFFSALSSLMTAFLLGIALAVGGGVALLRESLSHRRHARLLRLLGPLLALGVGLLLILRPFSSLRLLGPLLLGLFLVDGLLLMRDALRVREGAWQVALGVGAVNGVLGLLLALQWQHLELGRAGTLTGLYLLSRGVLLVAEGTRELARLRRSPPRRTRAAHR
jgi:uncharacterized membrane protein HdeD (DUF308 family)